MSERIQITGEQALFLVSKGCSLGYRLGTVVGGEINHALQSWSVSRFIGNDTGYVFNTSRADFDKYLQPVKDLVGIDSTYLEYLEDCQELSFQQAKLVWALGGEVDVKYGEDEEGWRINSLKYFDMTEEQALEYFFRFRKPKLIINGLKVPHKFKPKNGETFYVPMICEAGYREYVMHEDISQLVLNLGAWRTKEDAKLVTQALLKPLNVEI